MSADLFFRREGAGKPIVILHGLYGSSDNFGHIGRTLASAYDMILVDERDHGRSPHTDRITYPLMAEDVHALFTKLALKEVVLVGHSMGGKTAMVFAQHWPELLRHLVVIDIGPRQYPIGEHAVIAEALASSDLASKSSRQAVEAHLAQYIPEPGVVQFLMKSLYWREPGKLAWRFNVPLLQRDMGEITGAIGPGVVQVPTLFIRGGKSPYIPREDLAQIKEQFPNGRVETIPYAGHWVHAQAPEEVMDFIRSVA
ncbi:MAG TPA: alpha/beta fold hydrolase [Flavobacteriales bacterium]|nr:alpha/beta fold hydrolase [Flavobacteriales bacterium]HRN36175.1 alpha/beta fold hydrolase [Flavobacteriales bacterium]HRO39564.1 alpha/beta fold hydrolase [Flavobacteriales bacterium]HRP81187.1 alpha/beta fold hydrolase [Flavobacteriales bacterium]HRQ84429.1 alpha/beta fold hydrolase [Flavobacteriales bacterium]